MTYDPVSQIISRFIGLFELSDEQAKMRHDYDQIRAQISAQAQNGKIEFSEADHSAPYRLIDYKSDVPYRDSGASLEGETVNVDLSGRIEIDSGLVRFENAAINDTDLTSGLPAQALFRHFDPGFIEQYSGIIYLPPPPPGSVGIVLKQTNLLRDNDVFASNEIELDHEYSLNQILRLGDLVAAANSLAIIDAIDPPGSEEMIGDIIISLASQVEAIQDRPATSSGDENSTIIQNPQNGGIFVNGVLMDEAPSLADFAPQNLLARLGLEPQAELNGEEDGTTVKTDAIEFSSTNGTSGTSSAIAGADGNSSGHGGSQTPPAPPADTSGETGSGPFAGTEPMVVKGEGEFQLESNIEVNAGGNLLSNSTFIYSAATSADVIMVAGDSYHFNIITQTNIWSDHDLIVGPQNASEDPGSISVEITNSINLATITTIARQPGNGESANAGNVETDVEPDFPNEWVITTLDSNLVYLNWVEQYNYISDQDTISVEMTGSSLMLEAGGSTTFDQFSLFEIGFHFDLIIVSGNIYSANIINQTNILLDDDRVESKVDDASLSTSNNLLWNEASITSYGEDQYNNADNMDQLLANIAAGKNIISDDILSMPEFEGLHMLRVLYVKGDFYDLQYVHQTNTMVDSDQVKLEQIEAMASPDASITVTTGSNGLINKASLIEVGPDSNIMVAGNQYSDALIHQAELAAPPPEFGGGNELASEAVVFLVDDLLNGDPSSKGDGEDHGLSVLVDGNAHNGDVMQTMLS